MELFYHHAFLEELDTLDRPAHPQIRKKLREIHRTPFEQWGPLALKGTQFKGLFKVRVGDWRLIYRIVDGQLFFVTLGHRSEIYRP